MSDLRNRSDVSARGGWVNASTPGAPVLQPWLIAGRDVGHGKAVTDFHEQQHARASHIPRCP